MVDRRQLGPGVLPGEYIEVPAGADLRSVVVNYSYLHEPTTNLRFVERDGSRVLQQLWSSRGGLDVEWRDVPLEVEEPK